MSQLTGHVRNTHGGLGEGPEMKVSNKCQTQANRGIQHQWPRFFALRGSRRPGAALPKVPDPAVPLLECEKTKRKATGSVVNWSQQLLVDPHPRHLQFCPGLSSFRVCSCLCLFIRASLLPPLALRPHLCSACLHVCFASVCQSSCRPLPTFLPMLRGPTMVYEWNTHAVTHK